MGKITALTIGLLFLGVGVWVLLTNGDPIYGWGGVVLGIAFVTYMTVWGKKRKRVSSSSN
nr:hypothetical protein BJQ95_03656 [Cryobacterium sp. SO1]